MRPLFLFAAVLAAAAPQEELPKAPLAQEKVPPIKVRTKKPRGLLPIQSTLADPMYAKARAYEFVSRAFESYSDPSRPADDFVRSNMKMILADLEDLEAKERRRWTEIGRFLRSTRPKGRDSEALEERAEFILDTRLAYLWGRMFPDVAIAAFGDPEIEFKAPGFPLPALFPLKEYKKLDGLAREIIQLVCEAGPGFAVTGEPPLCSGPEPQGEPELRLPAIENPVPPAFHHD